MVRGPRIARSAADRKMDKALANGHGGFEGRSILEILEEQLTEACKQYFLIREATQGYERLKATSEAKKLGEARGRVKGLAMSVATLRHPLRVGDEAWWKYVKKLETRHSRLGQL